MNPNDISPLGIVPGAITLLVNFDGIGFLPVSAQVSETAGGSGYFDATVPVTDDTDAVALRLLGVPAADIARARRSYR